MSRTSRAVLLSDVIAAVETTAPLPLARPGDPVGLHCGSPSRPVRRVAIALDAGLAAQERAARMRADLLLVHHPRFYGGLKSLREDDPAGRRAANLARLGIAVYSAHTNLDAAPGGVNDTLADIVGLSGRKPVVPVFEERLCKLVVFVPAAHAERVRKAVCRAGAGEVGKYSECTFRVRGAGTFRCGAGTAPFQGRPGSFEEADEFRLETVFHEFSRDRILAALLEAHPYEEAAYDIHPLLNGGIVHGLGRAGELPEGERTEALAARLAAATGSTMTQYRAAAKRPVRRVCVWAGAGVDVEAVLRTGTEALVAGEVPYHAAESLLDSGVSVVTLGHGYSEEVALRPWAARLRRLLPGVEFRVLPAGLISMTNAAARG